MGRDKATLVLDGTPMVLRVAAAARAAGARRVVAVGGDGPTLAGMGLEVLADDEPGAGPVAALATALANPPGEVVLALSCDLVDPSPAALARVCAELERSGASVAVPVVGGRHQWLHSAWRPDALGPLRAALGRGDRSFAPAVAGLDVREVHGLAPRVVADADSPADLDGVGRVPPMEVPEIDVATLRAKLGEGVPLVDVREDDEFAEARVPGARHIPLGQVPERIGEVPADATVYVICARGGRSARAVEHYRAAGLDAVNVAGGTLAWIDAGLPTESGAPE